MRIPKSRIRHVMIVEKKGLVVLVETDEPEKMTMIPDVAIGTDLLRKEADDQDQGLTLVNGGATGLTQETAEIGIETETVTVAARETATETGTVVTETEPRIPIDKGTNTAVPDEMRMKKIEERGEESEMSDETTIRGQITMVAEIAGTTKNVAKDAVPALRLTKVVLLKSLTRICTKVIATRNPVKTTRYRNTRIMMMAAIRISTKLTVQALPYEL
jgi:hypothetical protein